MEILQEKTDWDYPNHSYVIRDGKMLAYLREGSDTWTVFSKPLSFSKKGRLFTKIKGDTLTAMEKHFA